MDISSFKPLVNNAFTALNNSYSPYSKFKVGACIQTKSNKYFLGTNIENISFGLTVCAERNAIFSAYSNGYKKEDISAIAVVTNDDIITTPCGACRQVLSELLPHNTPIILSNGKESKITYIDELLPDSFKSKNI
ncbi:cytidine deaminase [Peptostreptococcus faecalis]|uniref:cytidine deaminase n=1 Tax=Peptostreptococcus faecalis TaxID=2045015 RepID=UPI0015E0BB0A|nr:cytidine deaminase [Peptostreptococcus faecalis]